MAKYIAFQKDLALDILALIKGGRANSLSAPKAIAESLRKLHDMAVSAKGQGKFLGHYPRWSKTVQEDYAQDNAVFLNMTKCRKYRHEHVVPVLDVAKILLKLPATSTIDDILNAMDTYGIVAIITREEDSKLAKGLPKGWNSNDTSVDNLYVRYINAGLFGELSH
jgi:hypothetical protein